MATYLSAVNAGFQGSYNDWMNQGRPTGGTSGSSSASTNLGTIYWTDINNVRRGLNLDSQLSYMAQQASQRHYAGTDQMNQYLGLPPDIGKDPRADLSFRRGINYGVFENPEEAKAKMDAYLQLAGRISGESWRVMNEAKKLTGGQWNHMTAINHYQNEMSKFIGSSSFQTAKQNALVNMDDQIGGLTQVDPAKVLTNDPVYNASNYSAAYGVFRQQTGGSFTDFKNKYGTQSDWEAAKGVSPSGDPGGTGEANQMEQDAIDMPYTTFKAKYPDSSYTYWKETHQKSSLLSEKQGGVPDYEGGSPDPSFDEYLTFDEYLESLPDKGQSLIDQWEALADQQIGDDYVKLKDKLQEQFDLFKQGQDLELGIAEEQKVREERYLKEDLDRFKLYASEDYARNMAETDTAFAKALSSAATGYMDRGIDLSPMTYAGGAGLESRGLMHKAAAEIRESVTPTREKIESAYTRGLEGAEGDFERGIESLSAGYSAFKSRQAQALAETKLKKTTAEEEYDIDRERLKAGLVATRKAEERAKYTSDQLRKFY